MQKTVLVTGSNGLLGQKITDLYLQHPEKSLIATGSGPSRHPKSGTFEYVEMDIANQQQVLDVIRKYKPQTIIHCAAMTNVDACETQHEACDLLNVTAVQYLLDAAKETQSEFVYVSTDFIFDGKEGPYDETGEPAPLSYYGQSKWEAEKLVMQYPYTWSIARTVLVFGVVNDMSRSNIVLWAKGALEKGDPIKVVNDQFRTPTLAEDLAMGCFLMEDQHAQGIYNISGKDFMGIDELVKRVGDFFKLSTDNITTVSSDTLNQPAKRPPVTGFKLYKAIKELGYNPHSFEEGLQMVEDQLSEK